MNLFKMMGTRTELIDYFPTYLTSGIFSQMPTYGAPWTEQVGHEMDDIYFSMYSGIKQPTRFVMLHLDEEQNANVSTISNLLWSAFGKNWQRLWDDFQTEYNPIDNYAIKETVNRTESDERDITVSRDLTSTTDSAGKVTDDYTANDQVVTTPAVTLETDNYQYGFNSADKVPTTVSIENQSGKSTDEISNTHTDEKDFMNKDVRVDTEATSTKNVDALTEDTTRNRSGNIGQNTYQELLTQEFELWKNNFYKMVFEDTDSYLTLSVYTNFCHHSTVN